jgi:glycosyltransferase involved in cell wall biosynthesis
MKFFGSLKKRKQKESIPPRRRVIFVSHEATRTGAPKIILNILRHFNKSCDIQCETMLHSGGHLASSFAESSVVDCMNLPCKSGEELTKRVAKFVQREKNNTPILAVCNSMESRFVARELASAGIPTVSLVHELPSSYSEEDYSIVFDASEKVVFPVHFVKDAADNKTPLPHGKSVVLSQGLLDPDFGTHIDRQTAHTQIRKELGLPENTFIVLGCGTLDLRKGIDHYVQVARRSIEHTHPNVPVHFVWVGDGPRWTHSPYHYVNLDLDKSPAREHVHFIGERDNVEPYFMGSDAFLMSSRVDPFPCVIHEAMATGLPVITFEGSGGASEAVGNGAGFIVPYADYDQTAGIIQMLANQPDVASGIREKSRERVVTRYRFEDYADKLIDLCESVIGTQIRREGTPKLRIHMDDESMSSVPMRKAS